MGYGADALSTLLVMFGLSSIFVGVAFYTLGYMELGNVVYFFPAHVMVGCIGGIGVFIAKTGIEVTTDASFSFLSILAHGDGLLMVAFFECLLRVLEQVTKDKNGKPRYALLSPIYFCLITPVFYVGLWIAGVSMERAVEKNYFFPSLDSGPGGDGHEAAVHASCMDEACTLLASSTMPTTNTMFQSIFNKDLFEMWTIIDFSTVSWSAIFYSIPTLIALVLFSLIHVPINIPAFAISTKTEADMNRELIAHGYSNIISGFCGGLQNYMAYTQSVVYDRSGGNGKVSGIAVALVTTVLFFIGPAIASYLPRCMASTLLLHVGVDLFLEGVYDSIGKFDTLEYVGIWLICVVMTFLGMDAAMLAGAVSAVVTYAVQTVVHLHPVRGWMSAVTLRSSVKNRTRAALEILDDSVLGGRGRILVVQLQGHLFFGNVAQLNESVNGSLLGSTNSDGDRSNSGNGATIQQPFQKPWILIMDFSLVLAIDTSATQAIVKLKDAIKKTTDVTLCIFVTGSNDGFPCEYDLSHDLSDGVTNSPKTSNINTHKLSEAKDHFTTVGVNEETALLVAHNPDPYGLNATTMHKHAKYEGSHVFDSMDEALAFAENALIARTNPTLIDNESLIAASTLAFPSPLLPTLDSTKTQDESVIERATALRYLENLCPSNSSQNDIECLFSFFRREVYHQDEFLWKQGSEGNCAKLLVWGVLLALLENEAGTRETIPVGNMIGELGLVMENNHIPRMSSVICATKEAVVYSLSREDWEELVARNPRVARFVDYICISYLANRVQHVSNRIFETRCLPI